MSQNRLFGVFTILLLLITSCTTPTNTAKTSDNLVLLIAHEQSADMELMLTKEVGVMISMLEKAGYKVIVASVSGQPINGTSTTLKPDLKLDDVKVEDYAGIILPSMGMSLDLPFPPAEAVKIAKKAATLRKPMAAQLGGVFILYYAGALDGKQFAMYKGLKYLITMGTYRGEGVVQDGNIITSGICPLMAKKTSKTDGTTELTQKFIDTLYLHPEFRLRRAENREIQIEGKDGGWS